MSAALVNRGLSSDSEKLSVQKNCNEIIWYLIVPEFQCA